MAIRGKHLINEEELRYLNTLHQQLRGQYHEQDVNLFNIIKTMISSKVELDSMWESIQQKLFAFHGRECYTTSYFLEYTKGSYAAMHRDNPLTVDGTAITLLDRSDDLEGGDIITVGEDKQRKIIPQLVGQTVYYDTAVVHGVSKVTKGMRIVLITWFRKDTWQK